MSLKHTQGPWEVAGHNPLKIQGFGPQIQIKHPVCTISALGPNWKANAKLIAASPELLDIAFDILSDHSETLPVGFINHIRSVVSKATEDQLIANWIKSIQKARTKDVTNKEQRGL